MTHKSRNIRRISVLITGIGCAVFLLLLLGKDCLNKQHSRHIASASWSYSDLNNALWQAAAGGDNVQLGFLLGQGADCNATDHGGQSALMAAVNNNKLISAELLLKAGADCEYADPLGRRVLAQAAAAGNLPALDLLLRCKARINSGAMEGKTALLAACRNGQTATVVYLLKKRCDLWPGQTDFRGPVVTALRNNHPAIARILLDNGGNINELDENLDSVLILSVRCADIELVQYILKNHHPDLLHTNKQGENALDVARKIGNRQLVALLEKVQ